MKDGVKHGQGKQVHPNGEVEEGIWVDGTMVEARKEEVVDDKKVQDA